MSRIEVVKYDPTWPDAFESLHAAVWPAVKDIALELVHVGSTSVPGLAAKPVIDACVVVPSRGDVPRCIERLAGIGYTHRGDLGVPDREAFRAPEGLPRHHLYLSPRGSLSLRNQIGLRDYLREHAGAAREYGDLKILLARRFHDDIDRYVAGKTDFILGILGAIGISEAELAQIRRINQAQEDVRRATKPMSNPWLGIPLSDYEAHMSLPTVRQAAMLADELELAIRRYAPDSVAIIGCAGGNGFERIPSTTARVVGVDINAEYLGAASARYGGSIPGLELRLADIEKPLSFAPVALIYAALVFEYVALPAALANLAEVCQPEGHLVTVLQQPSENQSAVSPSAYRSLEALGPMMRLLPPAELAACAGVFGFALDSERTLTLESGKKFVVQEYRRSSARPE